MRFEFCQLRNMLSDQVLHVVDYPSLDKVLLILVREEQVVVKEVLEDVKVGLIPNNKFTN